MSGVIAAAATFALLSGGWGLFLLSRQRSRARRVRRLQGAGELKALPAADVGGLTGVAETASQLRLALEVLEDHHRELEMLNGQLSADRRPLWLRMEASHLAHDVLTARQWVRRFLEAVEDLGGNDRALLSALDLDLEPLELLLQAERLDEDSPDLDAVRSATAALRRFEAALASHQEGHLYR